MSNKITTPSYFIKRLRDSGYVVYKLFDNYSESDSRAWTAVIDPGGASIICTCYINNRIFGVNFFEIYDGGQFIPEKIRISTESVEVIITYLVKFNINNKSPTYKEKGINPATK